MAVRRHAEDSRWLLRSPCLELELSTGDTLRAVSLTNRLTGRTFPLGQSAEVELDVDAARRRMWIEGWRTTTATDGKLQGRHLPECNDGSWSALPAPNHMGWRSKPGTVFWARTHVYVPEDCRGLPLTLMLGGFGVSDFRRTSVFVNGRPAGVRQTRTRWFSPGMFDVGKLLRVGQDNVIALQLAEPFWRTKRLEERDPHGTHDFSLHRMLTSPYMQCVAAGIPQRSVALPVRNVRQDDDVSLCVELDGAEVRYELIDDGRTLKKTVKLTNAGAEPMRVLRMGLGDYNLKARVTDGDMGFPAYAEDEAFFAMDHPAGWVTGEDGRVQLNQHPGKLLAPGESFEAINVLLGVAEKGQAVAAFRDQLGRRMRRVVRKHDKPLTMLDFFGAWDLKPTDTFMDRFLSEEPTEAFAKHMVRQLSAFRKQTGRQFDLMSVDFWCDRNGDMTRFKTPNFPRGFTPLKAMLNRERITPAFWVDVSGGGWSIGGNPVIRHCSAASPAYPGGSLGCCHATDPFLTILTQACLHHLKHNGVRLFKFDSFFNVCYHPHHAHWPGLYSVEPIFNAMIEHCRAIDAACPDAWMLAYWAFASPWWLLHMDMLFECGLFMEGSSPGPHPTLYARDGVTLGVDQGTRWGQDIPSLGKDSLGVWLSSWPWNSSIGKERWAEAMVMNLCRGSLLMELWCDRDLLNRAERTQLATFLSLLKAQPACFANTQPIGDPWSGEPYGYHCSDGVRTFIALNNCTWQDQTLSLPPCAIAYRWHPSPARLAGDLRSIALRPFEVVLLELVPEGMRPSLPRRWATSPMPSAFAEPTRMEKVRIGRDRKSLSLTVPPSSRGGMLVVMVERSRAGRADQTDYPARELQLSIPGHDVTPVLGDRTYACAWQAWRVTMPPSTCARKWSAKLVAHVPAAVKLDAKACFIPA
ncbi:MAG: hypothetical protein IT440_06880 [Phycisphaeraceae bacterium]|nr:hypothetical protein [Phycisphaeraceae bacterium]